MLDCHPDRRQVAPALCAVAAHGLQDEPRPGAPRTFYRCTGGSAIVTTLEGSLGTRPSGHQIDGSRLGMLQSASRIWRAFGLKQHPSFKLRDPQFIDNVDVAWIYLEVPDAAVVVRGREDPDPGTRPHRADVPTARRPRPDARLHPSRHDDLYASLDVASGCVITEMTPRHRAREFQQFLTLIDRSVPRELARMSCSTTSTHRTPAPGGSSAKLHLAFHADPAPG